MSGAAASGSSHAGSTISGSESAGPLPACGWTDHDENVPAPAPQPELAAPAVSGQSMTEPQWQLEWQIQTNSPAETVELGRRFGRAIASGPLVVGLVGPLGAGKTLFVRAVAEGLAVPEPGLVASPTFVLIREYFGRLTIYHFDAYRLSGPEQFELLGPEEYFESDAVCLVEWADRVADAMPAERVEVQLAIVEPEVRRVTFRGRGAGCKVIEAVRLTYRSTEAVEPVRAEQRRQAR